KKFILILLTTVLFISCDETKKVIDAAGNVQLSGTYNVVTVGGETVQNNNPYITFTALDKAINGNTGCNSFFGKYTLDLYALSFMDIASTEKACDQPIMDVENAFLQALRNTGSYQIQDGVLTLYSKNDRAVLLTAQKEKNSEN
ncbi:MAG: hypothetical protein CL596_05960, partial [Alteromonas sp.]|nr:hypothetical protein [Alteromonas sp.]